MNRLASPMSLWWIAALIPVTLVWWWARRRPAVILYADLSRLDRAPTSWRVRLAWLPRMLRILFVIAAAVALARPQAGTRAEEVTTQGVDIVIVLDRSGSMRALDFEPNRLEAAKRVANEFVRGRQDDRVGLVVFATESYTACPMTVDHSALSEMIDAVDFATGDQAGTAIGLGLASAIDRLTRSNAKSKVVILVTDGVNTAGSIAPATAVELAVERGIKIYSIGVGTRGYALMPVPTRSGRFETITTLVELDEPAMTLWSEATGGRYFRATDDRSLENVFATIDTLETSEITSTRYISWADRFELPLLLACALLGLELLLLRPIFGRIPG